MAIASSPRFPPFEKLWEEIRLRNSSSTCAFPDLYNGRFFQDFLLKALNVVTGLGVIEVVRTALLSYIFFEVWITPHATEAAAL